MRASKSLALRSPFASLPVLSELQCSARVLRSSRKMIFRRALKHVSCPVPVSCLANVQFEAIQEFPIVSQNCVEEHLRDQTKLAAAAAYAHVLGKCHLKSLRGSEKALKALLSRPLPLQVAFHFATLLLKVRLDVKLQTRLETESFPV